MQASSVYVREMFAITESVKKWRQYLIGRHFHIFTDQKSLKNLLVQTIQTPEQQKWAATLQGFSFDITYKPGKSNLVEDALRRKFTESTPGVLFMTTSSILPSLLTSLTATTTLILQVKSLQQRQAVISLCHLNTSSKTGWSISKAEFSYQIYKAYDRLSLLSFITPLLQVTPVFNLPWHASLPPLLGQMFTEM